MKVNWEMVLGLDLNQRPSGYEPDELPDCSTPRYLLFASKKKKYSPGFKGGVRAAGSALQSAAHFDGAFLAGTKARDEKAAARFAPAAAF